MRYYYKSKTSEDLLNLKEPTSDEDFVPISEAQFLQLSKPVEHTQTEVRQRIVAERKKYLYDTDYIVLKIAEAMSEGQDVTALRAEYAEQLAKRKECRAALNVLI